MIQEIQNGHAATRWFPVSAEDRELILEELEAILASYHFRGSRRYPALLRYIVLATLEHRSSDLKERTLGVEVFGRNPGYDTNADPVVRTSAGEVRKRIAQFYHENGRHSHLQIELPLGSYAPEFLLRESGAAAIHPQAQSKELHAIERDARVRSLRLLAIALGFAILLGTGVLGAAVFYHRAKPVAKAPSTLDRLWNPMLQTTRPVLIVLRTAPPERTQPESAQTAFGDHVHYVSVSIATALAHLASVLNEHGKGYEVKEAPETTLIDMRARPVILVGAIDNDWTMRLVSPLRFHFLFFPDGTDRIEDSANPGKTDWQFNRFTPFSSVTADYAIVARFHNATTEGPVMVIAGLGAYGTEAAGEFVQSPQYLFQLSKAMPPGWEDKNLELVLRTDVIGYHAGPPVLLTACTW
jgi:hypothetical protein